jgi:hypothetical protein
MRSLQAMRSFLGTAVLLACLGAGSAVAGARCTVPLAGWQPKEALQRKLEAEGWTVIAIRFDDGCYKVRATNGRGERLEEKFNPANLEPVRRKREEEDD